MSVMLFSRVLLITRFGLFRFFCFSRAFAAKSLISSMLPSSSSSSPAGVSSSGLIVMAYPSSCLNMKGIFGDALPMLGLSTLLLGVPYGLALLSETECSDDFEVLSESVCESAASSITCEFAKLYARAPVIVCLKRSGLGVIGVAFGKIGFLAANVKESMLKVDIALVDFGRLYFISARVILRFNAGQTLSYLAYSSSSSLFKLLFSDSSFQFAILIFSTSFSSV